MPKTVYVVGADGYKSSYVNWLEMEQIDDFSAADLIFLTGGGDWNNDLYSEPNSGLLNFDKSYDAYEMSYINRAIEEGKKIFGTCRGYQALPFIGGLSGSVFQNIRHSYYHDIKTYDGKSLICNSLHHNLPNFTKLKEGIDYIPLAWTSPSKIHINGWRQNIKQDRDIEAAYFPKLGVNGSKAMGYQWHQELLFANGYTKEHQKLIDNTLEWGKKQLDLFMEDKL